MSEKLLTIPTELVAQMDLEDAAREDERLKALAQFVKLARASSFRSIEPYPSRSELNERSG